MTKNFVPCSAKHKGCTPAHSALVWAYRAERRRQELALEAITGGYEADKADYFARGGKKLITFKDWLCAHKGATTAPEIGIVLPPVVVMEAAIVLTDAERADRGWDDSVPAWAA